MIILNCLGSVTLNQWKSLAMNNHLLSSLDESACMPTGVVMRGCSSKSMNVITVEEAIFKNIAVQTSTHPPIMTSSKYSWSQGLPSVELLFHFLSDVGIEL